MHVPHFGDPRLNIPVSTSPQRLWMPLTRHRLSREPARSCPGPQGQVGRVVSGPHTPFPPAPCYPPGAGSLPGTSLARPVAGQPGWAPLSPEGLPPKAGETQRRGRCPRPPRPRCGISEISFPVTTRRQVFLFLNPSPVAILVCVSRSFLVLFFFRDRSAPFSPWGRHSEQPAPHLQPPTPRQGQLCGESPSQGPEDPPGSAGGPAERSGSQSDRGG